MRERAAQLGGHVSITSAPGEGTLVRAAVPVGSSGAAVSRGALEGGG
jgi:nitrate/nitrite-specific signal transduction histidine kinase